MKTKYTREFLEPIVRDSISLREVARKLGLVENNSTNYLKPHIIRLEIDTSHFKSHGVKRKRRYTDEEIFVEHSMRRQGNPGSGSKSYKYSVAARLRKYKEYKCEKCGNIGEWMGKPLTLQVDHINGKNTDNRLENLRYLCPNCHTQEPTTYGRMSKRKDTIIHDEKKNLD